MSVADTVLDRRSVLKWTLLGMAASCSHAEGKSKSPEPEIPVEQLKAAAMSGNQFAIDLQKILSASDGNWFSSPASISTALAMTATGAKNQTLQEMQSVLHAGADSSAWLQSMGGLSQLLNSKGEGHVLRMVNQLWGQKTYPFHKEFLQRLEREFAAALQELDFQKQPEQCRQTINSWVSSQTEERIQDLLPSGSITALTRMVLTNAIYMKADWLHGFNKTHTKPQPFFITEDETVNAPLMTQKKKFGYAENETAQVISLPYKTGDLSMVVLLPKSRTGLAELEASLTVEQLNAWHSLLRTREVRLYLPRFKMESSFNLNHTLGQLGMPTAFGTDADFTGISDAEDLYLSDVVHKAFVEVDELGTEAAAATGVVVTARAAPPQYPTFRADHPFLFLITHQPTQAILFMGRLQRPV
ncbi:MAG: serpin family protein [Planctomycetaceae bacterium]|nr:serpin family protein [Planctomycetaceae bacterium]